MGDLSKALGAGAVYSFDKKEYRLCGWTLGVQSEYELYLEGHVLAKARILRRMTPRDELHEADPYTITVRDIDAGLWSFGGVLCEVSLRNEKNLMKAVHIMLQETEGNGLVPFDLVQRMFKEDGEGIIEALKRADHDPNSKAPVPQ